MAVSGPTRRREKRPSYTVRATPATSSLGSSLFVVVGFCCLSSLVCVVVCGDAVYWFCGCSFFSA